MPPAKRSDIPPHTLLALNSGQQEARTLVENLATDFQVLLKTVCPQADVSILDPTAGITRRMQQAALAVQAVWGPETPARLIGHPSDLVRGWAAYALAMEPDIPLIDRLTAFRPLADDHHFGVREWAWIALRPYIAADLPLALTLLAPWTQAPSARIRRFAIEITRPRGVWCSHIASLKADPSPGFALLTAVRTDPDRYVQDSVANWLNDAAKSAPAAVQALCRSWQNSDPNHPATTYIIRRALRSVTPA